MDYNAFKRSFQLNSRSKKYSLFLGAGASIESGIKSASQCIWDWKKSIYDSNQSSIINGDIANDRIKTIVQLWLDKQGCYPKLNSDEEYSFYAENAYPDSNDRNEYFRSIFESGNPSIGYKLLVKMASACIYDKIWTTNFDDMYLKSTINSPINVIDVTTDSAERVKNRISINQTMLIKLHGDYKYCELKNTTIELQHQNEILLNALKDNLTQNEMIIIGYSGRDTSIMQEFSYAIKNLDVKTIYWLGYEKEPSGNVQKLIDEAQNNNKNVYYIQAPGFDNIMLDLSYLVFKDNSEEIQNIKLLKNEYADKNTPSVFSFINGDAKALIKSNIIYFSMPELLQFIELKDKLPNIQDLCKEINQSTNCVCRHFKGLIYFIGDKKELKKRFGENVIVNSTPLNINVLKDNSFIKYLVRDAIIKSITNKFLQIKASKNLLYKAAAKSYNKITYHDAIKINIGEHNGYPYLSLNMSIYFDNKDISKHDRKKVSDYFYSSILKMQANLNNSNYIEEWKNLLFQESLCFVNDSIKFSFTKDFAFAKIVNAKRSSPLIKLTNEKAIQFIGNEILDPQLQFLSADKQSIVNNFHPMKGLIQNEPFENAFSSRDVIQSVINVGVVCPEGYEDQLYGFLARLNQQAKAERNVDYLISYPGFLKAYKTNICIPYKNDELWQSYNFNYTQPSIANIKGLYSVIKESIIKINNKCRDAIIIVYIPDKFNELKSFLNNNENFDLHNEVKAFCIPQNIATQFINQKTITDTDFASIMWTLSLALYVKSGKIPWTIKTIADSNTAYIGIGYSIDKTNKDKPIVLGCSNIYSGDGQALKYKLSKINDPQFDERDRERENPYLTEHEAYELGCKINDMCHKSFTNYPKRVVIHKRTPFKECEINGLRNSLLRCGAKDVELLEIKYSENLNFTQLNQSLKTDFYPVNRGLAICIDDTTALLYTHGVAKSVLGETRKFFLGGKNIPKPLVIKRYCGESDLMTICEETLGLTRMNWNNFNLYSKMPCTIESSSIIAQIGFLLAPYDGTDFDQRLFM